MDRNDITAVGIVEDLSTDIDESKATQYFGGDSLIVSEYKTELSDADSIVYRLTLTADDSQLGVLPSSLELLWDNPAQTGQSMTNYMVWQVFRDDGVFEWRIEGAHILDVTTYLVLQYIGKGTVVLEEV